MDDIAYVHQLVYDLRLSELQVILDSIKHNKTGNKQCLRKRVLGILSSSSVKARQLRQTITKVYKSRPQINHQPQLPVLQPQQQSQNFMQRYLRQPPSYNLNYPNISIQPISETTPNLASQFENLPFYNTVQTLLMPMYCQTNVEATNFTGLFFLTDNVRHNIVKSWNITRQEYKTQIILRLVQVGLQENVTERLPYNIAVSVNERQCKLPTLNIPTKAGITPWRCNVPIDITQQTELRSCSQNTLKITWSEECHEYMAGVYVAQKLTWNELLIELRKRPVRPAGKTKELIKKSMESDADMGIDSMFATVKDPLSKTRMELPARGLNCIHMQCFDAIQFLQMNEQKQTWLCPLCKKKIRFEDIEVDEFFLNILQSPNLSEDCENVILLEDGSWTEKKIKEFSNSDNNVAAKSNIEVFTLSDDSDDDYQPDIKRSKHSPPKVEEPVVKSENIGIENCTIPKDKNTIENDLVLDLSLKNSLPSTSSDYQPIITINDNSNLTSVIEPNPILRKLFNPHDGFTDNNRECKPSGSGTSRSNKRQDNGKPRAVLCVITLD